MRLDFPEPLGPIKTLRFVRSNGALSGRNERKFRSVTLLKSGGSVSLRFGELSVLFILLFEIEHRAIVEDVTDGLVQLADESGFVSLLHPVFGLRLVNPSHLREVDGLDRLNDVDA